MSFGSSVTKPAWAKREISDHAYRFNTLARLRETGFHNIVVGQGNIINDNIGDSFPWFIWQFLPGRYRLRRRFGDAALVNRILVSLADPNTYDPVRELCSIDNRGPDLVEFDLPAVPGQEVTTIRLDSQSNQGGIWLSAVARETKNVSGNLYAQEDGHDVDFNDLIVFLEKA